MIEQPDGPESLACCHELHEGVRFKDGELVQEPAA